MSGTTEGVKKNSTDKRKKPYEDPLTKQDVEIVVKRAFGPTTKTLNYYIKTFSEEKIGMMGTHRHLVVTIQREASADKELHTFFLKSIPYEVEHQVALIEETNMFYKETKFYEQLAPELLHDFKDKSWFPACHLIKDDVLVFEDLKSRNFTMRSKFLDLVPIKSALNSLAQMHAASILTEKRLGKSLLEMYPKLLKESIFVKVGRLSQWHRSGTDIACAVAKYLGLDVANIPKVTERVFEAVAPSKKWLNVVCHGDAWSYNLMFDDVKPLPRCILVDFQAIRYSPPVVDILELFYLTTSRAFRNENERNLLKQYYETLCETLRKHDGEIALPSLDEILMMYEELRIVGVVAACIYFPLNLVDGKLCAELMKDSDGFAMMIYGDRLEMVMGMMRNNQFYREKLSEAVTELVQRSEQLLA